MHLPQKVGIIDTISLNTRKANRIVLNSSVWSRCVPGGLETLPGEGFQRLPRSAAGFGEGRFPMGRRDCLRTSTGNRRFYFPFQRAGGRCEPAGKKTGPISQLPVRSRKACGLYPTIQGAVPIRTAIWVATRKTLSSHSLRGAWGFFFYGSGSHREAAAPAENLRGFPCRCRSDWSIRPGLR